MSKGATVKRNYNEVLQILCKLKFTFALTLVKSQ